MTTKEQPLEPCPFCGGDAELDTRQSYALFPPSGRSGTRITVYCRDCGADIGVCREDVPNISAEEVIEAWNRRAPNARVQELESTLADARNYIECTVLNASSPKTRRNYQGCLNRIDAKLKGGV